MTFQALLHRHNLKIIRTYNDYRGKTVSICRSAQGVLAIEYEFSSGEVIGVFRLESGKKTTAAKQPVSVNHAPQPSFLMRNSPKITAVLSFVIVALLAVFAVYMVESEKHVNPYMNPNSVQSKQSDRTSGVSLSAEMLSQMMGTFYQVESKDKKLVLQERWSSNQLFLHREGQERLNINRITKKIVRGHEGEGLLYTGYSAAPVTEMIVVALHILNDNSVSVTLTMGGKETNFRGVIKKI